jgi:alpha-tubulin suppressor-like RCC1 family protein
MKWRLARLAALLVLAACGDDPVGGGGGELSISADTTYVAAAETVQLAASGSGVAWRSLDEPVATVSASGLVTGRGVGAARIVAEAGSRADTIRINVTPSPRRALAAGNFHACALDVEGKAHCWGANQAGQLGNGTTAGSATPVAVSGGLTFESIDAGLHTTCAVTPGGDAYCWGAGTRGQLGNGDIASSSVPVKVAAPAPLASVSVGGYEVACALGRDGTAYCWGANVTGSAGTGDKLTRATPTPVSTDLKFASVSAGLVQSCALTADGTAYCWGTNTLQTLGTGDTAERLRPAAVAGGLRFTSLSAGSVTTCAVATSGGAYCWGSNHFGNLGAGSQGNLGTVGLTPSRVVGDAGFVRVAPGVENQSLTPSCFLTGTGQAYCLGANSAGQLGTTATTETCILSINNRFGCSSTPLAVEGGLTFETVEIGALYACGLTPDGRVFCWGAYPYGDTDIEAGPRVTIPNRAAATLRLP